MTINMRPMHCLLLLLALAPWAAWASGLGEITVESTLNQPFVGRIEVLADADENPSRWVITIGDDDTYARLGLERPRYADQLRPTLIQPAGRPAQVLVEGRGPLIDLILDLVVTIEISGDRQDRHYAVLIDFPTVAEAAATPVAPAVSQRPPRRPIPPPPRPARRIAGVAAVAGEQTYTVQVGDNLYNIARQARADRALDINDVMDAIYALNPDAFIRGDMNLIRSGARLTLPELGPEFVADLAPSATAQPRGPTGGGQASRDGDTAVAGPTGVQRPEARLELRGNPDTDTIVDSLNEWLDVDDAETVARVGEVRRDLAFAAAEIETYRKENDVLRGRIDGLEGRIREMERLLKLQTDMLTAMPDSEGPQAETADVVTPESERFVEVEDSPAATADATEDRAGADQAASDTADVVAVDAAESESFDWQWLVFPGVAVLLLLAFAGFVFVRTMREDRRRRQKTAELASRLRTIADGDRLPEDI